MGCEGSQIDGGIDLPRKKPTISPQAVKLISQSQYDQAQAIADSLFSQGHIYQAIQLYQKIIESSYVHEYEIQGVGSPQLATSRYEWFIYKWYSQGKQGGKFKGNPYDALSLCYSQLYLKDKTDHELNDALHWYEEMLGEIQSYSLYMGYANILFCLERYQAALKIYQKVIDLKPTLLNAYTCIALIYQYKRIQKPKAMDFAKKILTIDPQNMYALFILARNQPNVDEKITKLKAIHEKIPQYLRVTNQIGVAYGGVKKDHNQAISWYKKCVQRAPEYASALRNIGVNLELQKQQLQALSWYFRACEKNPTYKAVHEDIRDIFTTLNYTDEQIQAEIKKHPGLNLFQFYYNIGIAYTKDNKIDVSLKWYTKAAPLNKNSYLLENSFGIAYDQIKDYVNAQKHYNRCIKLNPEYYSAYFNLAILYRNQNNFEKAIQYYKKAVTVNPTYSFAYNNLGNIYKHKKDFHNAIDVYKKAVQSNSTYSLALTNLGMCYLAIHRYRDAFDAFSRAKQALPTDNNNLSEANKAFLKENLQLFEKEGQKWISNGEVNTEQKGILHSLFKIFEQRFGNSLSDQSSSPALKPQVLKVIRLIHEDQFELKKILQIFQIIKTLFKEDEEQFHILPIMLIQYFETNTIVKKRLFSEVQTELKKILSDIVTKQAGQTLSPTKSPHNTTIKLKHYTPPEAPAPQSASNITTYESLSSQILKANDLAVKNLSQFVDLVEDVRKRSNGIQFVTRMKIPRYQTQQFRPLLIIMQKIFKQELTQERISQIQNKIGEEICKIGPKAPLQTTVNNILSIWAKEITNILSERTKKKQTAELPLSDLIKGKVRFNTIQELSRGLQVLDNICFLRKYEITGLLNRLTNRQFKDVMLTIKIHQSLYSLRFTLSHSETTLNLHNSLKELQISVLGCALGSYLFMSQGFSYPLTAVCEDVQSELAGKQGEQDKRNVEAAKYIRAALVSDKKP